MKLEERIEDLEKEALARSNVLTATSDGFDTLFKALSRRVDSIEVAINSDPGQPKGEIYSWGSNYSTKNVCWRSYTTFSES